MRCRSMLLFVGVILVASSAHAAPGAAVASPRGYVEDQIIAALESFRANMTHGWPELGVPPLDPLNLGDHNLNISTNGTDVHGSLTNVKVTGLSTFNIDYVHFNMLLIKADVTLGIAILDVAGGYNITGKVEAFPIFGEGPFRMDAFNLTLKTSIDLNMKIDGSFVAKTVDLDIDCPKTEIKFEGIMGGGEMEDFINGVLSSMGPGILQALEDSYMPYLEEALKNEINNILQGSKCMVKDESVNDYFDMVFANIRHTIIENGEDPLPLPSDSDNFTITLFNTSLAGSVTAGPGLLHGLSTLHRTGDMSLVYVGEQDEAIWQGEVGLIDLQVDYGFGLTMPLLGRQLGFTARVSFIHLSFETDVFLHQSDIVLAYCNITKLGPVHLKESGAGPLDTPLYNLLINALVGELEAFVSNTIQGAVCSLLEGALGSTR